MNCSGDGLPCSGYSEDPNITFVNQLSDEDLAYWNSTLEGSRYTVQRVLFPIAMIIGVIGNSITIAVLTRRHMKTSTNFYLTALAVSDLMYLIFAFSLSLKHIPGMSHSDNWFYFEYYRYALWLTDASSSTSTWLTVTFTIERYIAVCHPIKGKVLCTESRAKKVICGVFFFCFLLTVTTPHEWEVKYVPNTNGTEIVHEHSSLWLNETFKMGFSWVVAVIFHFVPLILLTTFNAFLVLAVKKGRRQRFSLTVAQKPSGKEAPLASQEYKITVMLIAVVLMAIICLMPTAIMIIYTSFHVIIPKTVDFYLTLILNNFFNFLTAVNATTNFIFYCVLSDRYRKTFLKTFCTRWYEQQSPQLSWAGYTGYSNCEDGSPYMFSRSSTRRSRRRSSYRDPRNGVTNHINAKSSGSSSPRNSPSRASFMASSERHYSKGEAFLMVPNYSSIKRKKLSATSTTSSSLDAPLTSTEQTPCFERKNSQSRKTYLGTEAQKLLPQNEEKGHVTSFNNKGRRPSKEGAQSINESTAGTIVPTRSRWRSLHLRRFLALLRARKKNRAHQNRMRGQSIVITCQQASFDQDQTSV